MRNRLNAGIAAAAAAFVLFVTAPAEAGCCGYGVSAQYGYGYGYGYQYAQPYYAEPSYYYAQPAYYPPPVYAPPVYAQPTYYQPTYYQPPVYQAPAYVSTPCCAQPGLLDWLFGNAGCCAVYQPEVAVAPAHVVEVPGAGGVNIVNHGSVYFNSRVAPHAFPEGVAYAPPGPEVAEPYAEPPVHYYRPRFHRARVIYGPGYRRYRVYRRRVGWRAPVVVAPRWRPRHAVTRFPVTAPVPYAPPPGKVLEPPR